MKTIIDPSEQLEFKTIKPSIKDELERREGNKEYVYNRTPFVRVSCLQEVAYTDEQIVGKSNNLKETKDSILVGETRFNGFQFIFDSNFDESYGEVQKIGKTLDNKDIRIKNPRRVPPPALNSFTATVGESSDYFTTAQLSFTCNSLEQLQFIVPFLFNPGNTIFVEFGHNTEKLKNQISFFDSDDADRLVNSTVIDLDSNSACDEGFIERMNKRIFESGGAYDFFYGIINNFDFSLNESLGYDCTVDLIAASKMKLKAPNTDEHNNSEDDDGISKITALTLASKLTNFERTLYEENDKFEKDIIFSFTDDASDTYVRLDAILAFLDGKFSEKAIDYKEIGRGQFSERQIGGFIAADADKTNSEIAIPNLAADLTKDIDTTLFEDIPNTVRKADIKNGEPPIVSYSRDFLLFRKKMWNPTIYEDTTTGRYTIEINKDNVSDDYVNGKKILNNSSIIINQSSPKRDPSNANFLIPGQTEIKSGFGTINPYLMDIPNDSKNENLNHSYIRFGKFTSIYMASEGKPLDVLKNLQSLINYATNNQWQIEFFGDTSQPSKKDDNGNITRCEKTVTKFASVSSYEVQVGDTYVFKANSKDSVFNSMDYGLGLEGLLGDQIYMNSINSSDGSMDSKKLNLLLFANHENNLVITDKRNRRIATIRKSKEDEDSDDPFELLKDTTYTSLFFGKKIVINSEVGILPSRSSLGSVVANSFYRDSDDPTQVKLEDFNKAFIKWEPTRADQDRVPVFADSQIRKGIFELYDIKTVPLIFAPVKEAIEKIRGNTDSAVQPSGEKKSQPNPERQRNFGGINPLLESTLDVTMTGIGGINPLEYMRVSGIPDVYANRGVFCVMNVSHTITPNDWVTQITTRFRPTYDN